MRLISRVPAGQRELSDPKVQQDIRELLRQRKEQLLRNAYIDARARFEDLRSGRLVGERSFNTTSSAWQGVFSAMTDKQLDAISRELIADTQGR